MLQWVAQHVLEHDVPQAWLVEHAFRPPLITACFARSYYSSTVYPTLLLAQWWTVNVIFSLVYPSTLTCITLISISTWCRTSGHAHELIQPWLWLSLSAEHSGTSRLTPGGVGGGFGLWWVVLVGHVRNWEPLLACAWCHHDLLLSRLGSWARPGGWVLELLMCLSLKGGREPQGDIYVRGLGSFRGCVGGLGVGSHGSVPSVRVTRCCDYC